MHTQAGLPPRLGSHWLSVAPLLLICWACRVPWFEARAALLRLVVSPKHRFAGQTTSGSARAMATALLGPSLPRTQRTTQCGECGTLPSHSRDANTVAAMCTGLGHNGRQLPVPVPSSGSQQCACSGNPAHHESELIQDSAQQWKHREFVSPLARGQEDDKGAGATQTAAKLVAVMDTQCTALKHAGPPYPILGMPSDTLPTVPANAERQDGDASGLMSFNSTKHAPVSRLKSALQAAAGLSGSGNVRSMQSQACQRRTLALQLRPALNAAAGAGTFQLGPWADGATSPPCSHGMEQTVGKATRSVATGVPPDRPPSPEQARHRTGGPAGCALTQAADMLTTTDALDCSLLEGSVCVNIDADSGNATAASRLGHCALEQERECRSQDGSVCCTSCLGSDVTVARVPHFRKCSWSKADSSCMVVAGAGWGAPGAAAQFCTSIPPLHEAEQLVKELQVRVFNAFLLPCYGSTW
jgi:hypothetical protein